MRPLFLLFVLLPILELVVLIQVGTAIGVLPTIGLVLLAAATGIHLLRRQSLSTLSRAQSRLQAGDLPGQVLVEGFLITIAGVLLLSPGFITDIFAFCLLLPWSRRVLVRWLRQRGQLDTFTRAGSSFTFTRFGTGWPLHGGGQASDVFEGEFTRERGRDERLRGPTDE
jgi:UPF0716 protein FxsA